MDDDAMIARYRKTMRWAWRMNNSSSVKPRRMPTCRCITRWTCSLTPFPYNGGTTTSHGIWMGVPTLTLAGSDLSCPSGLEIMHIYGLDEFVWKVSRTISIKPCAGKPNWKPAPTPCARTCGHDPTQGQSNVAFPFSQQAPTSGWRKWCADRSTSQFRVTGTED